MEVRSTSLSLGAGMVSLVGTLGLANCSQAKLQVSALGCCGVVVAHQTGILEVWVRVLADASTFSALVLALLCRGARVLRNGDGQWWSD